MPRLFPSVLVPVLLATTLLAQEEVPGPAAELKALAGLVGNWSGSGKMVEPNATTNWTAAGTYGWVMDGHFLREDFMITFEGMPEPMVFRAYMGWDREEQRYVNVVIANSGEVKLNAMKVMPDGSILQLMLQDQQGTPYVERAVFKVEGDTMLHSIAVLMPEGPSLDLVDGKFTRGGKGFAGGAESKAFQGAAPHADVQRLARMAGVYDVKGTMLMAPGAPEMKITGTDTYTMLFGGTILHAHTDGVAEGMPGKYAADSFFGWDPVRRRLVNVFIDNMGSVGSMDNWLAADGKSMTSISATLLQGQPTAMRYLAHFDDNGAMRRMVGHTIMGTNEPMQSFTADYTKK
ncbi:MAG: DUF1579 family protein [Planctomycetes bacterium]|nr:DUF1579 family protein [Planctomycetota bacterium]